MSTSSICFKMFMIMSRASCSSADCEPGTVMSMPKPAPPSQAILARRPSGGVLSSMRPPPGAGAADSMPAAATRAASAPSRSAMVRTAVVACATRSAWYSNSARCRRRLASSRARRSSRCTRADVSFRPLSALAGPRKGTMLSFSCTPASESHSSRPSSRSSRDARLLLERPPRPLALASDAERGASVSPPAVDVPPSS